MLPTGLAGFGTDGHVAITTQPFLQLVSFVALRFCLLHAHLVPFSFVSDNVFILLPLSIIAPCTIEYDSELLRTLYCMHQFTVPVQLTLGSVVFMLHACTRLQYGGTDQHCLTANNVGPTHARPIRLNSLPLSLGMVEYYNNYHDHHNNHDTILIYTNVQDLSLHV